jgi:hypothetical protein
MPRRIVIIPNKASRAVAIHPPEIGAAGRVGRGLPVDLLFVVNFIVVVAAASPGVTEGGVKVTVEFGGKFVAENVTKFGKLVPPSGDTWMVAEIG